MLKGEVARVFLTSKWGFGTAGNKVHFLSTDYSLHVSVSNISLTFFEFLFF
jgi:hypothetical protein